MSDAQQPAEQPAQPGSQGSIEKLLDANPDLKAKAEQGALLQLDPIGHFMCRRHGEPFRANWPKGVAQIIIMGMDFIAAPQVDFTDHIKGIEDIRRLLGEKQVCCRIEPGELMQVYEKAGIGTMDLCDACGKFQLGTPYKTENFWGRVIQRRHICFECVLYRMVQHKRGE